MYKTIDTRIKKNYNRGTVCYMGGQRGLNTLYKFSTFALTLLILSIVALRIDFCFNVVCPLGNTATKRRHDEPAVDHRQIMSSTSRIKGFGLRHHLVCNPAHRLAKEVQMSRKSHNHRTQSTDDQIWSLQASSLAYLNIYRAVMGPTGILLHL